VSEEPTPEDEVRGLSVVGMTLGVAVLGVLKGRGLVNNADINMIFDTALSDLERLFPPGDRSVQVARQVLEGLHQVIVQPQQPPD